MEYLRGTLILSVASIVCCENFIPVLTSCRYWDVLDTYSNDGDQRFHCILDQVDVPGIVYTEWTTVQSEYCPIYNRHAKRIDSRPCNSSIGECPSTLIRSYQGIAFTGCFQMPLAKPSLMNTEKSTDTPESDKKDTYSAAEKCEDSMHINIGFGVLTTLAIVTVAFHVAIRHWYRKCKRRHIPREHAGDTDSTICRPAKPTSGQKTTVFGNAIYKTVRNHAAEYASRASTQCRNAKLECMGNKQSLTKTAKDHLDEKQQEAVP